MKDKRQLEEMMANIRAPKYRFVLKLDPAFDDAIIGITDDYRLIYSADIMATLAAEMHHMALSDAYGYVSLVIKEARSDSSDFAPVLMYCA